MQLSQKKRQNKKNMVIKGKKENNTHIKMYFYQKSLVKNPSNEDFGKIETNIGIKQDVFALLLSQHC